VFTRKPLFAYRVAAAGMIGVALLSFFVCSTTCSRVDQPGHAAAVHAHDRAHLDPHRFLFLVTLGTLWKAKIRFDAPMLFILGMMFNFLIGGITGVFLSDVRST